MSRTIRRTHGNTRYHAPYVWKEIVTRKGNVIHEFDYIKPGHPEYKKLYSEQHRDERSGRYGVPRWYRANLNKSVNSKEKSALHRALARGQEEELTLNPRKNNAGYTWW